MMPKWCTITECIMRPDGEPMGFRVSVSPDEASNEGPALVGAGPDRIELWITWSAVSECIARGSSVEVDLPLRLGPLGTTGKKKDESRL